MDVEVIAKIAHQANKAYCEGIGDNSQVNWDEAPEWQRGSAMQGVQFHLDNPTAGASASHDSWLAVKEAEGWKYGEVKDSVKKEHPCYVPYEKLPLAQKIKDYIFKGIVHSFIDAEADEVVETPTLVTA